MTFLWRTPSKYIWLIVYAAMLLILTPLVAYLNAIATDCVCTVPAIGELFISIFFLPYLCFLLLLGYIRYKPGVPIYKFSWSVWELTALVSTLPGLIVCVIFIKYWFRVQCWAVVLAYLLRMDLLLLLRTAISNKQRHATVDGVSASEEIEELSP
jgi:hypothetical protein